MGKDRKVALGYVSGGGWKESFGRSLVQLALYDKDNRDVIDGLAFNNGLYVDQNRNGLAQTFLSSPCEWLFQLDTDIAFDPDTLDRLLDTAKETDAKIVSGLYIGRINMKEGGPQLCPVWFMKKPSGYFRTVGELRTAPQEVDAVGMGCVLIHRSVFEAFPYEGHPRRWFSCEDRLVDGKWEFFGEDIVFCDRAKALGFKIVGNSLIQVDHDKGQMLTVELMVKEMKERTPVPTYQFNGGLECSPTAK